MMNKAKVEHLTKEDIIKNGSIFTPDDIVKKAKSYVKKYIDNNSVIIDFGAGYGAFISEFLDLPGAKIATDIDEKSTQLLKIKYPQITVLDENSIANIDRSKYCDENKDIIVIGNPPYNDTTSQYKKGQKGSIEIDSSVEARDLGIAFLRMYGQIKAKYVCILHPMSYLIKKQNFKSLKEFKDNYKLIKASIFSSQRFESIKKGNAEFPVLIALYERNIEGMDYEYIRKFKFDIYQSKKKFKLSSFKTIDGIVNKYPTKDKLDTDLQFYTIRDINALKRNKSFLVGPCANGIKVDIENLHYYAWLNLFKNYFNPEEPYLYGNLSPLLPKEINNDEIKKQLYGYILNENQIVKTWIKENNNDFYKQNFNNKYDVHELMNLVESL